MSVSESRLDLSSENFSGREDDDIKIIRDCLRNAITETFEGICMWPLHSKKDIPDHHIYFNHDQRELGVAQVAKIKGTRLLWNRYCNGSFHNSTFIGVEDNDDTVPPIIFPLQGCWAHNGKELEIHEKTLQWALDFLLQQKEIEEAFEPDDWSSENCAVSDNLVYFLSAIGKKRSWVLALPVNSFTLEEPEHERIIFIDMKRPRGLLAERNLLTCFDDKTFLMIYEDKQYTFEFGIPILRYFRFSIGDSEVFYFVTAEGVEIRTWCFKNGTWVGTSHKIPIIIRSCSPLCFLYGQIIVLAESPGQFILINAQAEVERVSSPLSFSPGEYRALRNTADSILISLRRDTYLLCTHH